MYQIALFFKKKFSGKYATRCMMLRAMQIPPLFKKYFEPPPPPPPPPL